MNEPGTESGGPDWAAVLAVAAGEGGAVTDAFGLPVLDVPAERWLAVLDAAQRVGLRYFDWLSAVDALEDGYFVVAHLASLAQRPPLHLLVRTLVSKDDARLPTATAVFRGAAWHERETHEMFGIDFDGHPRLAPLLLPDGFDGHPLRKDFVLASRAAKPWPGAKEPGESDADAAGHARPEGAGHARPEGAGHARPEGAGHAARAVPARRRTVPPGVPDPETWGPRPPGPPPQPRVSSRSTAAPAGEGPPSPGEAAVGRRVPPRRAAPGPASTRADVGGRTGSPTSGPPTGSATGGRAAGPEPESAGDPT